MRVLSSGRDRSTPTTSFSDSNAAALPMVARREGFPYSRYMPEEAGFQAELSAALQKKARRLNDEVLPLVEDNFHLFQSLFNNLYSVLYRKSLIQEDPYQYERAVQEVVLPSREPIAESEKLETLSRRLAEFRSQLEFLNTEYQFNLEFLNLERLKLLSGLARYIDWSELMTASPDANTSVMAEVLGKIKLGADKISAGIVTDAGAQLAEVAGRIQEGLKEASAWQREQYKLELRRRVFSKLEPSLPKLAQGGREQALGRLQRAFRELVPDRPFHPDLVLEALAEDFSEDGPRLREEVLARLAVAEPKAAPKAPPVDYKALLLEAVRLLLPVRLHLGEALLKLESNRQSLAGRPRGFFGWLRSLFSRRRAPSDVLEIRQLDSATGASRTTQVNFPDFTDKVRKKVSLLEALSNPTSPASQRLQARPEQEISEFLNKTLADLHHFYRLMEGLDAHFKAAAKQVKGVKIELAAVKNSLVRAGNQRHEYAARKEEEKQRPGRRRVGRRQAARDRWAGSRRRGGGWPGGRWRRDGWPCCGKHGKQPGPA